MYKENCIFRKQVTICVVFLFAGLGISPSAINLYENDTISVENAACDYKGLMGIDRCFRSLKPTQIKISPVFHWAPRRIEAHAKICILALLIERVAELRCEQPWSQIRRNLEELQISHFLTNGYRFLRRNELSAKARKLLKTLGVSTPKLIDGLKKNLENALKCVDTRLLFSFFLSKKSSLRAITISGVCSFTHALLQHSR